MKAKFNENKKLSIEYHKMCIEEAKRSKKYHKQQVKMLKKALKRGFE